MNDRLWLDGWEHRPYRNTKKVASVEKRYNDLSPIVIWHQTAGVFDSVNTLYSFANKTSKPVCLWYADPDTTRWDYQMFNKWDGVRRTDDSGNPIPSEYRKGYEVWLETLAINRISWGCKSVMGRANFRGKLNIQLEDMGYSSDAGNMTEDELYRRGLVLASIGRGIMRYTGEDWVPRAYVNKGLPYPKSYGKNSGQRIPIPEFMSDMGGRNVLQHSLIPKNKHGDCGAMDFGTICEIARNELNQKDPEAKPKPQAKVKVVKPKPVTAELHLGDMKPVKELKKQLDQFSGPLNKLIETIDNLPTTKGDS